MHGPDLSAVTVALTKEKSVQEECEVKWRRLVFQRLLPSTEKDIGCPCVLCVCVCAETMQQ